MMFSKDVIAYVFFSDETCSMTVLEIKIPIIPRQRPADYIYTPEQVQGYAQLLSQLNEAIEDMSSLEERMDAIQRAEDAANRVEGGNGTGGITGGSGQPEGGSEGQALIKTDEGVAWQTLTPEQIGALPSTYTPPTQTAEQVGADPKGTAAQAITDHNTNVQSHNDLRIELEKIKARLTAFFDTDDSTLDDLSEIIAYIDENKDLFDEIASKKVSVTDIADNLTTNIVNRPLSASQGVVLKGLIDGIEVPTNVSAFNNDAGYLTEHQDISGKLDANKLSEAVDNALAQAKASGEFDGPQGDDGNGITSALLNADYTLTISFDDGTEYTTPSIRGQVGAKGVGIESVIQTATSTENGGENTITVTLTDGTKSSFVVRNGQGTSDDALIGEISSITPSQVVQALIDGKNVLISAVSYSFGTLSFSSFLLAVNLNLVASSSVFILDGKTATCQLEGNLNDDVWNLSFAEMSQTKDIPSTLPNPNALTFAGAATGTYDGSEAKTITIPTIPNVADWALSANKPSYTAEEVSADPAGTATQAVSSHNTDTESHNDLRVELQKINDRLNAFFDSDDATLDELSEIVAYITSNKTLIEAITTSKVSVSDIVDNLTTNIANRPLSAAQGVALKGLIDAIKVPTKVSVFQNDAGYLTGYDVTKEDVTSALGYTPASEESVGQLSEKIDAIGTQDEIVQAVIAALPVYNGEVA